MGQQRLEAQQDVLYKKREQGLAARRGVHQDRGIK